MSQSGFIAGILLAAFILWLAVNDRLNAYSAILFGNTQQPKPQGNISVPGGIIAPAATGAGIAAGGAGTAGQLADESNIIDTTAEPVGGGGGLLGEIGEIAGLLEFIP